MTHGKDGLRHLLEVFSAGADAPGFDVCNPPLCGARIPIGYIPAMFTDEQADDCPKCRVRIEELGELAKPEQGYGSGEREPAGAPPPIKLRPGSHLRIRTAKLPPGQRHSGRDVVVELVLAPVEMTYAEANERQRNNPKGRACEVNVSPDGVTTFQETIPIPSLQAVSWRVDARTSYATAMLEATGVELDVEGTLRVRIE